MIGMYYCFLTRRIIFLIGWEGGSWNDKGGECGPKERVGVKGGVCGAEGGEGAEGGSWNDKGGECGAEDAEGVSWGVKEGVVHVGL